MLGIARAPIVQLVNSTFVSSISATNQQQHLDTASNTNSNSSSSNNKAKRVKMDCRVSGNPAPWVEWFRNGKLLRNRLGGHRGVRIKTSKVARRPSERLSRLEIELQAGRNETGIYECRAMSVAAREPTVGAYTLLVLAERQFALVPMQQVSAGGQTNGLGANGDHLDANTSSASRAIVQIGKDTSGKVPSASVTPLTSDELTPTSAGRQQQQQHSENVQQQQQQQQSETSDRQQSEATQTTPTTTIATDSKQAAETNANTLAGHHQNGFPTTIRGSGDGGAGTMAPGTTTATTSRPAPGEISSNENGTDSDGRRVQQSQSGSGSSLPAAASKGGAGTEQASLPNSIQRTSPSEGRKSSPVVVGQPCPGEAHDNFCLNRGTCVLIGHIEEYFCK